MISSLRLQHFRSYSDESFEFDPRVNIVIGPNGSGKTNLLEAVLVLARGSSYRAKDSELIKHRAGWARLEGFYGKQHRLVKLRQAGEKVEKSFQVGEKPYKRLSLDRTEPVVFFEPNHLQFISRGPEQRREYIDGLLERSQPGFKALSAGYRRVVSQRNALLKKDRRFGKTQLFAWNIRLSDLGGEIAKARQGLTQDINRQISVIYSGIAGKKSTVLLEYGSHFPVDRYASRLLSKLEKSEELDYLRGFTAYGPHREDITVYLNSKPVNQTASRGETRSLVLALKIFELSLIGKARGQEPILLLDDVFSELDGARRHALVDYLKSYQTIITTTDAESVIHHFTHGHNLIAMSRGSKG